MTAVRERVFNTPTEKLMMMVLADYINADDECWPGNNTVAQDVGVGTKTIERALNRLVEEGVLERTPRWGIGPGRKGRLTDTIRFIWEGFLHLPLVGDQTDILTVRSPDQTDIGGGSNGHPDAQSNGHLPTPSVLRTPVGRTPSKNPPEFDRWWATYPRHESKQAALRRWPQALAAVGGDVERLIAAAERYRDDPNRDPRYTCHPDVWLNKGRWDDDPLPSQNSRSRPSPAKADLRFAESMERARRLEGR